MKNTLQYFKTAFAAEHIKKRGTGIYTVAAILGIIVPAMLFTATIFADKESFNKIPYHYYLEFIYQTTTAFAGFFFPVLIIINASRIAQLDHKNGGWQLMEIQPLKKSAIYFSKFLVLIISVLIAIISCVGISLLFAWILTFFKEIPPVAILDFPFSEILNFSARIFVAAFCITALQYMLAVLIPGFIWPLLIGFLGIIITPILSMFGMVPVWIPFEILNKAKDYKEGSDIGNWFLYTEKLSLVLGVFFLLVGFTWYANKSFKRAFLNSKAKVVANLGILGVFGLITAFLLQPNSYESKNKTIIAGKIDSDMKFQKGYLTEPTVGDTIAIIDVKNNAFSQAITTNLPLGIYQLSFGDALGFEFVFSSKDSVFANVKFYNGNSTKKLTGTRLAENQYKEDDRFGGDMIPYYLDQNIKIDRPEEFLKELCSSWDKAYEKSSTFRTRDNFVPKPDFVEVNQKLVCIKSLNYLHQFLDKRKALYPNEKTVLSADVKKIQSKISLHEESLISNQEYLDYLLYEISMSDTRDIDQKTKEIEAIAKLKPSRFKNRLLFSYLKTNLEEASSSAERKALVANYASGIQDAKLSANINNYFNIYERLGKGNPAQDFVATSLEGKPVQLSDLKGKFVAIDMWATWCKPCKHQSPYFEEMAIKYKKENIHFVAMNMDKDIKKWFVDAKSKSKSVLQLHINDIEAVSNTYNLMSIPRFILIDAEGKIFNSKMPFPDEESFEMFLRKALKLKDIE